MQEDGLMLQNRQEWAVGLIALDRKIQKPATSTHSHTTHEHLTHWK